MTFVDDGSFGVDAPAPSSVIEQTWTRVDVAAALEAISRGEPIGPSPTLLVRSDGVCLMYPGAVHQFAAEPESGKTWILLSESARIISDGGRVVFLDFEDSAGPVLERMLALGVPAEQIVEGFVYVRPDGYPPPGTVEELAALEPTLVVVDGVSAAFSMLGLDLDRNQDVQPFHDRLARPFQRAGAAVAFIDHVTKNRETRGGHALGAGQKKARVAVGFEIEVVEQPARGRSGLLKLKLTKDKYGHLGEHASNDRARVIAMVHITSAASTGAVSVRLDPADGVAKAAAFRPTGYMEKVSRHLETFPGSSRNSIEAAGLGGAKYIRTALNLLIAEGFVSAVPGDRNSIRCSSVRPFREDEDGVSGPPPAPHGLSDEAEAML